MHPHRLAPEWRRSNDRLTGAAILQWTSHPAMQHHFYFTNPTVSADGRQGFFISYRTGYPNIFSIDLETGELTQVTDRVDVNPFSPTRSTASPLIYFSARSSVWAVSSATGEATELCRFPPCRLGNCSLDAEGNWLAVGLRRADHCQLALVETRTGRHEIVAQQAEIGHIQFCPRDANLLLFSGPPDCRLWVHDRTTGQTRPVYRQGADEWIVHESWLGVGEEILFTHWPHALGAIHPDGGGRRTVAAINAWHACSNRRGTQIVCDTNHPDRGLLLIDPATGAFATLCCPDATSRGTQWRHSLPATGAGIDTSIIRSDTPETDPPPKPDDPASTYGPQWTHPHPSFSPDGGWVIYTSDRDGWSHVYSVEVPDKVN